MSIQKPIIFMTGSSGMVGTYLTQALAHNYHIHLLERTGSSANNPSWNYRQSLKKLNIKAPQIVVHLGGAGIADKRWSQKYKKTIYESRINGTRWLADEVSVHDEKPQLFLSASAIGYYGHRPGELIDESSSEGTNFVAKIAANWEKATERLTRDNIRVVNMRFGMILSQHGGALKDMLLPFKLGLGGKIGNGTQMYSWISMDDVSAAIEYVIQNETLSGPVNFTTPNAVSNSAFTQTLANKLNRPAFIHMPKFMVRLIFGEVADELLLADVNVKPIQLNDAGFVFKYPKLDQALEHMIP